MVQIVFYLLAIGAVVSALLCITQKNPVSAAIWLVSTMFALSGIYVLLNAQFIAAMQVLVYAGAVMVLFLFVIMLLNLGTTTADIRKGPPVMVAGVVAVLLVTALLVTRNQSVASLAARAGGQGAPGPLEVLKGGSEVQSAAAFNEPIAAVAKPMFQTYLVPFELTSVLLLAAAVGAVVLAKRKL